MGGGADGGWMAGPRPRRLVEGRRVVRGRRAAAEAILARLTCVVFRPIPKPVAPKKGWNAVPEVPGIEEGSPCVAEGAPEGFLGFT